MSRVDTSIQAAIEAYAKVVMGGPLPDVATGIDAIDKLIPSIQHNGRNTALKRAAFLQAVKRFKEELSRNDQPGLVVERLDKANEAAASMRAAAKILDEIDNGRVADLVRQIAKEVQQNGAAAKLKPYVFPAPDGEFSQMQFSAEVLYPSALNTKSRATPRAGAIRTLAELLNPNTPSLNSKLKNLLIAIGIDCRPQDVQQALK